MKTPKHPTVRFHHIYGNGGRFILLEHRHDWLQLNDPEYAAPALLPEGLLLHDETLNLLSPENSPPSAAITIFKEEADRIERRRLRKSALEELARSLAEAQKEYDMEALLQKIDFHLQQDDIFK